MLKTPEPDTGNIHTDPCLVEPGYWDANGGWVEGNYHLLPTSPCNDSGDPNYKAGPNQTDMDGQPRIINDRVDIGADEYNPPLPAEVDIEPDTLNLTSKGKWITCYIWLLVDYGVADIDANSVLLGDKGREIEVECIRFDEKEQFAIAKFNRSEAQPILEAGQVELIVRGELADRTQFEGTDTIRVIHKACEKK